MEYLREFSSYEEYNSNQTSNNIKYPTVSLINQSGNIIYELIEGRLRLFYSVGNISGEESGFYIPWGVLKLVLGNADDLFMSTNGEVSMPEIKEMIVNGELVKIPTAEDNYFYKCSSGFYDVIYSIVFPHFKYSIFNIISGLFVGRGYQEPVSSIDMSGFKNFPNNVLGEPPIPIITESYNSSAPAEIESDELDIEPSDFYLRKVVLPDKLTSIDLPCCLIKQTPYLSILIFGKELININSVVLDNNDESGYDRRDLIIRFKGNIRPSGNITDYLLINDYCNIDKVIIYYPENGLGYEELSGDCSMLLPYKNYSSKDKIIFYMDISDIIDDGNVHTLECSGYSGMSIGEWIVSDYNYPRREFMGIVFSRDYQPLIRFNNNDYYLNDSDGSGISLQEILENKYTYYFHRPVLN